jgi:hypothetical protein
VPVAGYGQPRGNVACAGPSPRISTAPCDARAKAEVVVHGDVVLLENTLRTADRVMTFGAASGVAVGLAA